MSETARSFKVIGSSFGYVPEKGRYLGAEPKVAAQHAGKQQFAVAASDRAYAAFKPRDFVEVEIQETTRGSKGKTFRYKVQRKKLPASEKKAQIALANGKKLVIPREYEYITHSLDESNFKRNVSRGATRAASARAAAAPRPKPQPAPQPQPQPTPQPQPQPLPQPPPQPQPQAPMTPQPTQAPLQVPQTPQMPAMPQRPQSGGW
jgi:hypothetical protein